MVAGWRNHSVLPVFFGEKLSPLGRERGNRLLRRLARHVREVAGEDVDDHGHQNKNCRHPEERAAVDAFPSWLPRMMVNEIWATATGRERIAHGRQTPVRVRGNRI